MAAATQLGMSASSFLCPVSMASKHVESTSSHSSSMAFATPTILVVAQQDNAERVTGDISRRLFAVAAASSAAALGVFVQPEAQAKRKPPPQEEKKVDAEEKSLSAYDAKLLANARRKEALKATVEAAKAKARSVTPPPVPSIASPEE